MQTFIPTLYALLHNIFFHLHNLRQCRAACSVDPTKERPLSSPNLPTSSALSLTPISPATERPFDPASCSLPPESGPCDGRMPRFFHQDGRCQRFSYSGCGGNTNNFFTSQQCRSKCLTQQQHQQQPTNLNFNIEERVEYRVIQ